MKKISILIPTYNEQDNILPLSEAIIKVLTDRLAEYDYEIIFIDNHSTDLTRYRLETLCSENRKIKGILNSKILDNSIHLTMGCARRQAIVQS